MVSLVIGMLMNIENILRISLQSGQSMSQSLHFAIGIKRIDIGQSESRSNFRGFGPSMQHEMHNFAGAFPHFVRLAVQKPTQA